MFSLLVAIIYLSFISLGLPDSLLGSAWPAMHIDLQVSISSAGILQMIVSASTIVSALVSNKLAKRFGSGLVIVFSILLTALAMLSYSFATSFGILCLLAIPYGFGGGAIDSVLNNYAALHLSSRNMNWLHCCWGIGATISPYVMSVFISGDNGWRGGYFFVSMIQFVLTGIVALSIPLWKKYENGKETVTDEIKNKEELTTLQTLKYPNAIFSYIGFMFYCLLEVIPLSWTSTYLNVVYEFDVEKSAFFASLFAIGMAVSRAICGLVSNVFNDKQLMRIGMSIVVLSSLLLMIPFNSHVPALIAFAMLGFGCGPIYPGFVHSVPSIFGKKHSGEIIGLQLAFAYFGFTFSSFIFGKIAEWTTIKALPYVVLIYMAISIVLNELLLKRTTNMDE